LEFTLQDAEGRESSMRVVVFRTRAIALQYWQSSFGRGGSLNVCDASWSSSDLGAPQEGACLTQNVLAAMHGADFSMMQSVFTQVAQRVCESITAVEPDTPDSAVSPTPHPATPTPRPALPPARSPTPSNAEFRASLRVDLSRSDFGGPDRQVRLVGQLCNSSGAWRADDIAVRLAVSGDRKPALYGGIPRFVQAAVGSVDPVQCRSVDQYVTSTGRYNLDAHIERIDWRWAAPAA
jgi:hypothetical protein